MSHNDLWSQNTARWETEFHAMSEDSNVVGGGWPPPLVEVWPQERVQRHTVEHFADLAPMVQILDVLVPQVVDQLVEVFRLLDFAVPAQVIDVPKIPQDRIPQRTAPRNPQLVEQLVEVPTVSQTVGTPVLSLLQDFRPGGGDLLGFPLNRVQPRMAAPPAQGGKQKLGAVPAPKIQDQIVAVVDHAAQVPAVRADRQWSCNSFCSSTECWTFQLSHSSYPTGTGMHSVKLCRERETPQCNSWVRLWTSPSLCNDKCRVWSRQC